MIYVGFFMGEQNIWWGRATILLCIILSIINLILIITTIMAYYEAVEGDCRSYRIQELESEISQLTRLADDYRLKITDGMPTDVVSKMEIKEILSNSDSFYSSQFVSKLKKELNL
jgi:hypothetical protein